MNVVCFHNPQEENGYLSNWYLSDFRSGDLECAVNDLIWGIGLSMHDEARFDRRKWRGENLLGYALMLMREKIE